jgi:hypothetical protein
MSQLVPTETTSIGGKTYKMFMLSPMQSMDLLVDVSKMIGPSIGPVIDKLFSGRSLKSVDDVLNIDLGTADLFTKACERLFGGLDKNILHAVVDAFREVTEVDGQKLDTMWELHFRGKIGELFQWVMWGMKVQWGKSFSALGSEINRFAKELAARVKAQETE